MRVAHGRGIAALALAGIAGCTEYDVIRAENVDVFFQEPAEAVDILMIVDNSGSMEPYQIQLGRNFEAFIEFFIGAQVDYHIAVTTTTMRKPTYDPSYPQCSQADLDEIPDPGQIADNRVITPQTADAATVFRDLVNVGTCGSGYEMGLETARLALSPELLSTANYGFLRDEAALSIIFVSDEEDTSPYPVNEYINDFREVKGQRSREVFNASALVVTDASTCGGSGSSVGSRYIDVATQTHGIVGNLCAQDFAGIVTELSLNTSRLRDTFFLSREPDVRTLQVAVEDAAVPCDTGAWSFAFVEEAGVSRPAVVFARDAMPAPGDRVSVRYNSGSGEEPFCQGAAPSTAADDAGGAR